MKHWHTAEQVTAETYKPETNRHPTYVQVFNEVYKSDASPELSVVEAELTAIRQEKANAAGAEARSFSGDLFLALIPDLIRSAQKITRRNQKKVTMENKLLGERILGLED
jgi:hypothetical protein